MPAAPQHLPGTLVTCTAEGAAVQFFVTNARDPIQACHLRGEFFEVEELRLLAPHIPPGAVIADIGANIGNHAMYFDRVAQARRVVLFEANPDAATHLRLHGRLNRCTTRTTSAAPSSSRTLRALSAASQAMPPWPGSGWTSSR